jgi:ABC-type sugar transport system ATPase subunit
MEFNHFNAARNNGSVELRNGSLTMTIPNEKDLPAEVLVGVRPEHACLWAADQDLLGPLEGTAEFVEAMGRETFIGVSCDEAQFTVRGEGSVPVAIGDRVRFGVRPGLIYLFDPVTGETLGRL